MRSLHRRLPDDRVSVATAAAPRQMPLPGCAALLRCPCPKHAPLDLAGFHEGRIRCRTEGCRYATADHFPVVAGRPAVIDFRDSVVDRHRLEEAGGTSPVRRQKRGTLYRVRRLLMGSNRTAARMTGRVLDEARRLAPRPRVLIVGGGDVGSGAEGLLAATDVELLTCDIYVTPRIDFLADGHGLPLPDGSVHAVWIQAVLEHVLDPWRVVAEIHRVLVPDGVVYGDTPFIMPVHEAAYDFTRFTESGHRWLFRAFDRLESGPVAGPGTALVWAIQHFAAALFRHRKAGAAARCLFFWLRLFDRAIPPRFAMEGAASVYFLGRRRERPIDAHDVIRHYAEVRSAPSSGARAAEAGRNVA